jgi:hypothetical protein
MPMVNGKKYPYTAKGKAAAKKAAAKKDPKKTMPKKKNNAKAFRF